jgi:parvulin-like peptidyl-prolyl isomerase
MTFRAKPAVKSSAKRGRRPVWEADHRRTLLTNVGFGVVVVVALLILGGAAFASYYGEHFAAVATVNGEGISKDDYRGRYAAEAFRLTYSVSRVAAEQDAGHLDAATAQSQLSFLSQKQQSLTNDVAENLIDATLQRQLAAPLSLKVDDSQIDQRLVDEATTKEQRHSFVIGIKPEISTGATAPTDAQKTAARQKAEGVLADLKAGKIKFTDYALANSQDVSQSNSGDIAWIQDNDTSQDKAFVAALFRLPVNGLTDVLEGADGEFRIGTVTQIAPTSVDAAYQQKIKDAGVNMDAYRAVVRSDLLAEALQNKIVGDVMNAPTPQRHVSEIFLAAASGQAGTGDEVKVRHILIAPKHDPQGAQTLPATDPAWKEAENEADLIYQQVVKDPSTFQAVAKDKSDDTGTKAAGGDLAYYAQVNLDPAFGSAVFAPGLTPNEILPPVKSAFGWHVIQFIDRRQQPQDRIRGIQLQAAAPGADFAALAKANSEGAQAGTGGDIGWVAKLQLDSVREAAIFKAPVGGLTDVIQTSTGFYLYKIVEETTRLPDAAQADTIKSSGFTNWYSAQRNFATIVRQYTTSSSTLPTVQ